MTLDAGTRAEEEEERRYHLRGAEERERLERQEKPLVEG